MNNQTQFTLVLGGGGMKGVAHVGVLQALTERGLVPSQIVGSSVGALVGAVSGYAGGWIDSLIMRLVDLQLSFPAILVALMILAFLGKGVLNVMLALVIVEWARYARTARSAALVEAQKRGFQRGNREKAQLADGHRDRADWLWNDSRNVKGLPPEKDQLQRAADRSRLLDRRLHVDFIAFATPNDPSMRMIQRIDQRIRDRATHARRHHVARLPKAAVDRR